VTRSGKRASENTSSEVIASSPPGMSGLRGALPTASRMKRPLTRRAPIDTVCSSSKRAYPRSSATPAVCSARS
jgi:hypothetical protein